MQKCLLFFLLFVSKTLFSQVIDNFQDGDFLKNPEWVGDSSGYTINTSKQLQTTTNLVSDMVGLTTSSILANSVKWEFTVRLDFDPSAQNQMRIYLLSDQGDLKGPLNGYFLQIGENGNEDSYDLYKQSGRSVTRIIDGPAKPRLSSNVLESRILILRDWLGNWELQTATDNAVVFSSEGSAKDNSFIKSKYFGVLCRYTPGNSGKFFFDDLKISSTIPDDHVSPVLKSIAVRDSNILQLFFNEPVDSMRAIDRFSYIIHPGSIFPNKVLTTPDPSTYLLSYPALASGNYRLSVSGVTDLNGNFIDSSATTQFSINTPSIAHSGDLIINEILVDPTPQQRLPETEFVEIYNPSRETIALKGWRFKDKVATFTFQGDSIRSGEQIILCSRSDTSELSVYGKTIGISPWPALNNKEDIIQLISPGNVTIDSVAYSDTWYQDPAKKAGGWSLERIDPLSRCTGIFNWTASTDSSGGTPGRRNSVYHPSYDQMPFLADSVHLREDSLLIVYFNKPPDPGTAMTSSFQLNPEPNAASTLSFDPALRTATLSFDRKLKPATEYSLSISPVSDCAGNPLTFQNQPFTFKTPVPKPPPPVQPDTGKLYITEIFADPSPEVKLPLAEFIEVFNPGKDSILLAGWTIADKTSQTTIKNGTILPGEYLILCRTADTSFYQSFGKTLGLSPWPSLNNQGDEIVIKSHLKRLVDSVAYSDTWYQNPAKKTGGWSLERIDPLSRCTGIFNWTASADSSGGTPGRRNSVYHPGYDQMPFLADSVQLREDSLLIVYFNKPPDPGTAMTSSFQLTPEPNAASTLSFDPALRTATLSFDRKLKPATEYSLSISPVSDCAGNPLTFQNQPFTFKSSVPKPPPPVQPDTGKLYITEIFADPSPEVKLPLAEFIEVFNPGKDSILLAGWTIADKTSQTTIKNGTILPGEYLILCRTADTSFYQSFGKTLGLSPWPSLNNQGDEIVVKSHLKRLVDSVAYSDTWYQDPAKKAGGWSLERIDPLSRCTGIFNWTASTDSSGGTPGRTNSNHRAEILNLQQVTILSDSTLQLRLNQPPDPGYLQPSYFRVSEDIGDAQSLLTDSYDLRIITLAFGNKFRKGVSYKILVDSIRTCNGLLFDSRNNKNSFILPAEVEQVYPIVINEIFADPSPAGGMPETEFVELFNTSDGPVSLSGLSYEDSGHTLFKFDKGVISPKGYLILVPKTDSVEYQAFGETMPISPWPSLNNDGDILILRDKEGKELQKVAYNLRWYKDQEKQKGGYSLELIDPLATCSGIQNWKASNDPSGASPGKVNSAYKSNTTQDPLILSDAVLIDSLTLKLKMNRFVDSISAAVPDNYSINNGVGSPASSLPIGPEFQEVQLKFASQLPRGRTYRISISNVTDCAGIPIAEPNNSKEFTYAEKTRKGDILISEILFNPRKDGADFVEIFNPSNKSLDLKALSIASIKGKDSLISISPVSPDQFLFRPQSYLAFTTDPENLKKEYQSPKPASILKVPRLPAFGDKAGTVVLLADSVQIDRFDYSESMHFSLITDPEGVSLERSSFKRPANDPGNFRSAAATAGFATPGYKNSQEVDDSPATQEIQLLTKTFSPDNDGFEDILTISYNLHSPGMIANVTIFDDQGVLIRKLVRNMTLAAEGTFSWDGQNDFNQIAAVGVYMVYVEVFDLNGHLKKYRKNCVLATKLN